MPKFDVLIIGASAAGLMCAHIPGKRGRSVLLLDHAKKPAEKLGFQVVVDAILQITILAPQRLFLTISIFVNLSSADIHKLILYN